ncbi:MAG: hypothetical protein ACJ754_28870 [Pyrinomonadaceae bacterium]
MRGRRLSLFSLAVLALLLLPAAGGGPLLYKEWRFEGQVSGTGLFKAGTAGPTKYLLVLQGRGNGCQNAEDFKYWRLQINGRRAAYSFYGELADPE